MQEMSYLVQRFQVYNLGSEPHLSPASPALFLIGGGELLFTLIFLFSFLLFIDVSSLSDSLVIVSSRFLRSYVLELLLFSFTSSTTFFFSGVLNLVSTSMSCASLLLHPADGGQLCSLP